MAHFGAGVDEGVVVVVVFTFMMADTCQIRFVPTLVQVKSLLPKILTSLIFAQAAPALGITFLVVIAACVKEGREKVNRQVRIKKVANFIGFVERRRSVLASP